MSFGSDDFEDHEPDTLLDLVDELELEGEDAESEIEGFDLEAYLDENPDAITLLDPIPDEKLDDYWAIFCELDDDGSNQVSADEMHSCFRNMGIEVDADELSRIIASTDEDGSGEIDFAEFAHMLFEMHNRMLKAPIAQEGEQYLLAELARKIPWYEQARTAIWQMMDDPQSSKLAQLISASIMVFIFVSCVSFVVESLPSMHRQHDDVFWVIEAVCVTAFSVEYLLRLISAPHLWEFVLDILSIVDLVAILPFFLELVFVQTTLSGSTIIRVVRLVRIFRLFKMSRYVAWFRVVSLTLQASVMPLGMIVFVFSLGVVLFSSATYYAERGQWSPSLETYVDDAGAPTQFGSIPATFWWCVVTMVTVGYGDVVPQTPAGRIIAACASLSGVLILAIPISVISANFHTEYARLMKKAEQEAHHKDDMANFSAGASRDDNPTLVNKRVARNSATLLHHNSRMMAGHLKHVELTARTEMVKELVHDVDAALRRLVPVSADPEIKPKRAHVF